MVYTLVNEKDEFNDKIRTAGDKLVVVDFFATWCGPCKQAEPIFKRISEQYSDVIFLKVDVDENEDAATEYEIASLPTFIFFKNGAAVDTLMGALTSDKLTEAIDRNK
ncbi:thioredoxin-like [Galendromus occidentalis]|uniref:Thioredoxin n=1 Tax=Galendromus occidentalis TaxID=34638 RepID=A0AAJ6QYG4_9ACAR|nr:thioredoxin-like [Galendromus occidentalis]